MTVESRMSTSQKPEFPENWVVAGSEEAAALVVWLNGNNVSDRCIAFEKLYTARTAYWGTICLIVKVGPVISFDPTKPPSPAPLVYLFRQGILVWESVMDLLQAELT